MRVLIIEFLAVLLLLVVVVVVVWVVRRSSSIVRMKMNVRICSRGFGVLSWRDGGGGVVVGLMVSVKWVFMEFLDLRKRFWDCAFLRCEAGHVEMTRVFSWNLD